MASNATHWCPSSLLITIKRFCNIKIRKEYFFVLRDNKQYHSLRQGPCNSCSNLQMVFKDSKIIFQKSKQQNQRKMNQLVVRKKQVQNHVVEHLPPSP